MTIAWRWFVRVLFDFLKVNMAVFVQGDVHICTLPFYEMLLMTWD